MSTHATVTQANLQDGLRFVTGALATKATTLDVLSKVLLRVDEEGLTLTATDLDRHARILVNAETEGGYSLCVAAREFGQLVALLPDAPVTLTLYASKLTVQCAGLYELPGIPGIEYPIFPKLDFGDAIEVSRDTLLRVAKDVAFAVSREESRPHLQGVLWHRDEDGGRFVATDMHKMAVLQCAAGPENRTLLNPATLDLANGMPGTEALRVATVGGSVGFRAGNATVVSRTLAGEYPSYQRIIPQDNDKALVVETKALRQAIKRALTVSEHSRRVTLTMEEGRPLALSTTSEDRGSGSEQVPCAYTGEPLRIGVNGSYLSDILGRIPADEVRITLKKPEGNVLLHGVEPEPDITYLLAPLTEPAR